VVARDDAADETVGRGGLLRGRDGVEVRRGLGRAGGARAIELQVVDHALGERAAAQQLVLRLQAHEVVGAALVHVDRAVLEFDDARRGAVDLQHRRGAVGGPLQEGVDRGDRDGDGDHHQQRPLVLDDHAQQVAERQGGVVVVLAPAAVEHRLQHVRVPQREFGRRVVRQR
jgi:hypothetical protein